MYTHIHPCMGRVPTIHRQPVPLHTQHIHHQPYRHLNKRDSTFFFKKKKDTGREEDNGEGERERAAALWDAMCLGYSMSSGTTRSLEGRQAGWQAGCSETEERTVRGGGGTGGGCTGGSMTVQIGTFTARAQAQRLIKLQQSEPASTLATTTLTSTPITNQRPRTLLTSVTPRKSSIPAAFHSAGYDCTKNNTTDSFNSSKRDQANPNITLRTRHQFQQRNYCQKRESGVTFQSVGQEEPCGCLFFFQDIMQRRSSALSGWTSAGESEEPFAPCLSTDRRHCDKEH
jgi:hypothetical protein